MDDRGSASPSRLILVTGTATGVGKTWVAARLVSSLRGDGFTVAARKPVQSYHEGEGPTDADVLAEASGERPTAVCPGHRWYPVAMAPPMAASLLGRDSFTVEDLLAELCWPPDLDFGVVEGVGGPRSPLADGADTVDLAEGLKPDHTVLVADAGLGAINAVLMCVSVLPSPAPLVLLNGYDRRRDLHRLNAAWLRREGLEVVTNVEELLKLLH